MTQSDSLTRSLDVLTVTAIAVFAYMLDDILHEGLGHGGACVVTGGLPALCCVAGLGPAGSFAFRNRRNSAD